MRSRSGKAVASAQSTTASQQQVNNERKLTWADLGSDDEVSRALGIRLTYSKLRRKLKGERNSGKDENVLEDDSQIAAGLKALDSSHPEAELDVTSLVVKKKRSTSKGGDSSIGEPPPPSAEATRLQPLPLQSQPGRGGEGSTQEQTRHADKEAPLIDDSAELSEADLNLLVTTLSRLSHRMAINETPPPLRTATAAAAQESVDAFPLIMDPPGCHDAFAGSAFQPPPPIVPFCGPTLLPHWPSDDYTYVGPQNLTVWRQFLTTLAHAEPATLAAQLQNGLLSGLCEPQPLVYEPPSTVPLFEPTPVEPPRAFERRLSAPKVNSVRRPPSEGRFKQIARGKSTPEYLDYIRAVPKEMRRAGVDPATPRVEGTSWREFQAEVRAWKISLHRKSEALRRCGEERPEPTACAQGCI